MNDKSQKEQNDKTAERIAKFMARAGLCSRRDAERWIQDGRVTVNGKKLDSPACVVTENDRVIVDGKPVVQKTAESRLWLYHKPAGLVTTHKDEKGRTTVFDSLPKNLPRVISVGRLDLNSEGLLLLTNDGALAREMELPSAALPRRYRVRVFGDVSGEELTSLAEGVTIDGLRYGKIIAEIERKTGANAWLNVTLFEGKNREIRKVMNFLGLDVNRLIRVGYGPYDLGTLKPGDVVEAPLFILKKALRNKNL